MKITDVSVDSFGHWKGLQLPDLSPQVTVIYGPNEAGKSTLLHLIRGVFYGYSVRHHARFVPPRHPGPIGGQLSVAAPAGRFRLRRCLNQTGPLRHDVEGELSVQSGDGAVRGKQVLTTLLHGVDDAIFRNVFAVGLTEMQHLGTLSDTQAAQQLYGLAAGADRVSISEVAQQLEEARTRRLRRGEPHSLTHWLSLAQPPRASVEDEPQQVQRWLRLMEEQRQVQKQIHDLEASQKRFSPELAQATTRGALREQWKDARKLHQQLSPLANLPKIPTEVLQRIKEIARQIALFRKQWEKQRHRRRQLREQAGRLTGSPKLLHHAEPITALHHRSARVAGLAGEIEQLRVKVEETEFELQTEFERIGIKTTWRPEALPLITNEIMESLREPARICREARERTEAIEQEEQASRAAYEQIQTKLAASLKGTPFTDLTTALKRGEQQVRLLRQRAEIQTRLESNVRRASDLREEAHEWTKRQLIPWRGLMMIGLLFSFGMVLLFLSCFGETFRLIGDQRGTVGVLGAVVSVFALAAKGLFEFAAGRSAASCQEEMSGLRKQIQRSREEILRIDQQLGPSGEPWHVRLQTAEDEWEQLAELQPLEAQRAAAQQRIDKAVRDKEQIGQQLKDARQRWRDALRAASLPEAITPTQFRQMSQSDSPVAALRQKLVDYHEQHRDKQAELQDVQQKVQGLLERANLHETSDRLEEQIEQLRKALQQARESQQQRDALHRQWREAGKEQERLAREAKRLRQRRQELVSRYGVHDGQELKSVLRRQREATKLRQRRDESLKQMADRLGSCCTLADLRKDLERGKFEHRLRAWEQEHDQAAGQLANLHERRGELNQQIKMLASQREGLLERVPRGEAQTQVEEHGRHWLALAGISWALDQVRKSYESDRQPETLAEASTYLTQLTQGKYSRIWTPFGESALCVDDQHGRGVRVEHLSRGTREQVFLSLRLALAAEYSRRGAALPLILDDVFVNFDARRAEAAAQTVCRFAEAGHQVLVFTCHEHIRDVFHRLGVDLRVLPDATRLAEDPQPVLPAPPAELQQLPREPQRIVAPPVSEIREEPPHEDVGEVPVLEDDPELDRELLYGVVRDDKKVSPSAASPEPPPTPKRRREKKKKKAPTSVRAPQPAAPVDVDLADEEIALRPEDWQAFERPVSARRPLDHAPRPMPYPADPPPWYPVEYEWPPRRDLPR